MDTFLQEIMQNMEKRIGLKVKVYQTKTWLFIFFLMCIFNWKQLTQ